MTFRNSYRTLPSVLFAGAVILSLAGCGSAFDSRETIKQEQTNHFNETRIAIVLQMATQQYEVGDYDKCRESLTKAYSFNHPYAPAHILSAKVDIEKGQLESAANHLKTAAQINANDPEIYYLLGVVYQRWQNPQVAHDYYKIAWDKKPNEALYLLAVAEMKITLGRHDEAQKLLEDKLVYFEQTAAIRVALAKLYSLKGDHLTASKFYREASLLSPDDQSIRRNYAESLFFAAHYSEAAPVFEDLLKDPAMTDPANPNLDLNLKLMLGQSYLHLHRPTDARTCLAQVTRADPTNTSAWILLAQATLDLKDYNQAIGVAQRILKTDPDHLQVLILLARAQQMQKQWEQAQDTLIHARRLAPQNSTVLCLLGLCAQKLDQPNEAREFYRQAAAANPTDLLAQDLLASLQTSPAGRTPGQ